MRKLKLQVQMTVDGFIGGPAGEMDWMTFGWDDELYQLAMRNRQERKAGLARVSTKTIPYGSIEKGIIARSGRHPV